MKQITQLRRAATTPLQLFDLSSPTRSSFGEKNQKQNQSVNDIHQRKKNNGLIKKKHLHTLNLLHSMQSR